MSHPQNSYRRATLGIATVLVLASLFLVTLGFVGEYVGRVFMMVNRLPQFTVRRHVIQGKVYGHKPPESR